jgi:hypothetical protein
MILEVEVCVHGQYIIRQVASLACNLAPKSSPQQTEQSPPCSEFSRRIYVSPGNAGILVAIGQILVSEEHNTIPPGCLQYKSYDRVDS